MQEVPESPRRFLREIARRELLARGLRPDFPAVVLEEAEALPDVPVMPAADGGAPVRDLRDLPWFSIDNEGTRVLDQVTAAERRGDTVRVLVAISDVDALVPSGSALDANARHNAKTIYTPAGPFPLLPERVAANLGSLREGKDRLAVVVAMTVEEDGSVSSVEVERAMVHNHARLDYEEVTDWLDEKGTLAKRPLKMSLLKKQILLHEEAALRLRRRRYQRGALPVERWRLDAVFHCNGSVRVEDAKGARAQELIEDLMVASNEATAAWLEARGYPSLRRLVREPVRWPRLVALAASLGETLPAEPDSRALAHFLEARRAANPKGYTDLAYAVLDLIGPGEYVADLPGLPGLPGHRAPRHFVLAVDAYAHSTAPLRRYADLANQRLLKAALAGLPSSGEEMQELALHCTRRENEGIEVERQVERSAAALLLADRIGDRLEAAVVHVSEEGTWVRTCDPPSEGRVTRDAEGLEVGARIHVRLLMADAERGVLEFALSSLHDAPAQAHDRR